MTIYYDPTESRAHTRLPQEIIESGRPLPRLEETTGADLLLSPLSTPVLKEITDTLPNQIAFKKHCNAGMLVQRKSGRDLTSSIPNLPSILMRMLAWTDKPWLLTTGNVLCSKSGKAVIDGYETNFGYNALIGALDSWQCRGGYVSTLCRDSLIPAWTNNWLEKLKYLTDNPDTPVFHRMPLQTLSNTDWAYTLITFPNIGPTRARQIQQFTGKLAWALTYLSDMDNIKLDTKPDGVGPETFKGTRKWLGLEDGEVLAVINKKSDEIVIKEVEKGNIIVEDKREDILNG
jgi:hypothetical protein